MGGVLLCFSVCQKFDGPASPVVQLSMLACGERGFGNGSTPCVTQQYCLASMAAWIPSTGFYHHSILPHTPLDLSVCGHQQSSPLDCSIIPKLQLPVTAHSRGPVSLSRLYMAVARTV